MGTYARIDNGFISIDVAAWLEQRTAGTLDDLTRDLHTWAAQQGEQPEELTGQRIRPHGLGWRPTIVAWSAARGHAGPDPRDPLARPSVIAHEDTRLDADVWLARAVTAEGAAIVVVQLYDGDPAVYADAATDPDDWFDADTVEIGCPNEHGWTWRSGRELLTADGTFTTLTVVFGPNLDAPFTRCRDCEAYDAGRIDEACQCDGTPWIVCPRCGQRCDADLPTR
jgi:hypothetical protein